MPSYYLRLKGNAPAGGSNEDDMLPPEPTQVHGAVFAPPADVFESTGGYEIRLEVACVPPEDIDITVAEDGRTVTIAGRRLPPPADTAMRCLNLEIQYGAFARRFHLPTEVDPARCSAAYDAGLLVVRLPRLATHTIRRSIQIQRGEAPDSEGDA